MTGSLLVADLGALVAGVALLGSGGVAGLAYGLLRDRLQHLAPEPRGAVLLALALAPWGITGVILLACFLPSLLDGLVGLPDHCGTHGAHHPHLCFLHASGADAPAMAGALVALLAVAALGLATAAVRSVVRHRARLEELVALSEPCGDDPILRRVATDRPLAFTLGLLAPRAFVSEGMEQVLAPEDLRVVLAHERAHVAARDGARNLLAAAATLPFPPGLRRLLRADLEVACEQAADRRAEEDVGDPALVARALLAVARAQRRWSPSADSLACAFAGTGTATAARVRVLLDPPWREGHLRWGAALLGLTLAGTVGVLAAADPFHHAVETMLDWAL